MSTSEQPSLLHRAAHTPARDWLRGRITGRLDWRAVVAAAGLPEPLTALVTRVVRRSRLWRLERVDLAAELCAHFADGLASGARQEGLMNDFGNPTKASTLIRRAKKRGRHWSYRAFVHTCQGLGIMLLAAALAYGLLAWRFFAGKPTITRNYAAEYNQTVEAIPEDQRASEAYIETYGMLEPVPDELLKAWPAIAPEHPRYPEALAYLERQREVLEITHRAAALPRLGAPMAFELDPRIIEADRARNPGAHAGVEAAETEENPMMIGVLLPTLGHQRRLAQLLTLDAHAAALEGDAERVARDIETMLGVGRHAGDQPVLISALVRVAIEHLALNTLAQIIHSHPDLLTDDQLRALAHRAASVDAGCIARSLAGERWFFEDMVQRVYTDDGRGNGHLTAEGMRQLMSLSGSNDAELALGSAALGPITAVIIADRADMTAKYDELMARAEAKAAMPMWEYDSTGPLDAEFDRQLAVDPLQKARYLPISILLPAFDKAAMVGEQTIQRRDALLAGVALERYRRDHREYPPTLDALAPAYLPSIPRDRFTGERLRYAITDGRPRLWSVGADRNDDAGRAPAEDTGDITRWRSAQDAERMEATDPEHFDGDWVLWPIVYEPMTADPPDEPDRVIGGLSAGG